MGDDTRGAIGVFWDIENCHVPRFASALCLVQRVRERFFSGLREAEFMCVCDINKESKNVIEDLNNGQVNVVHINATSKNAADDKIRQSLRRFADTHPADTKVILISSDVNFATDLSDLRHRKHMYIILIHRRHVHEALIACAHEHYDFEDLFADLPLKAPSKCFQNLELVVHGYPSDANLDIVKKRLRYLSYNCGGRVGFVSKEKAVMIFSSTELLNRARKRMEGEDVLGGKIITSLSIEEKNTSHRLSPSRYQRNRSPATPQPLGTDRYQHSPAPGAPGDTFATKSNKSNSSSGSSPWPANIHNTSIADLTTRSNATQHTESEFINYVCDMVQFKPPALPQTGENTKEEPLQKQLPVKDGRLSRNMLMIQQQRYQEQQETKHKSGSPVIPSHSPSILPARFKGPLMPTPPGFDGSVPLHGVENGGTLNISKTVNFTYQSSYVPPPFSYPRPVYPHQQFQQNYFMPIPRPRLQMRYGERPRVRNNSLTQGKNGRAILSSAPDVFGDEEEEEDQENGEVNSSDSCHGTGPVDVYVSNLDYNISGREWRKILASTFQPHVQVLGIFVRTQPDNTSLAVVKVPSLEDARFAISQFHRRKIGYKRIHVSLRNDSDQAPAESTRQEAVSILSDAKDFTMPVFKFIEQYEKRYHKSISVSDLYKMKYVVEILDRGGTGRMVRLSSGVCPTPTPQEDSMPDSVPEEEVQLVQAVCPIHCPEGSTQHAEALSTNMLPNVRLQRRHFAAHVHSLLLSHNGVLPLMSFQICYSCEFSALPVCQDGGVPLEHLLSCVPGVEIKVSTIGTKVIHFQENKEPPGAEVCGNASPVLSQQLSQISREIGDLLRQSSHCMLPASKFIPAYHHHFGRQCRVADYGYTKLAELFEALPHVLQVLGTGDRKVLTLSHRAQVKRFIADLLKVLKSQPGKQLSTDELPKCYERVLARQFDITHYGVAFLEDLFMDIPPTSVLITREGNKTVMAIPKRDQTPEEMERTKQFALEVVDLLKHNPMCRMAFNKFIPAYHHHFGRQCRVADYGFTKLTDLFECISHVVEILEDQEERLLKLTAPEMRAVLSEQIVGLLRERAGQCLPVSQLLLAFQRQYGFPLCLMDYAVNSVHALLGKIKHCVSIECRDGCDQVVLRARQEMPVLGLRLLQLLMDQSGGCLPLVELCSRYHSMFGEECDVHRIQEELLEYVQVSTENDDGSALIRLTALQTLGRDIRVMLRKTGSIPFSSFAQAYLEHFSVDLKPALYGFIDIHSLLTTLPHIVNLTGRPGRQFVELSPMIGSCQEDDELVRLDQQLSSLPRFEDFLSAPVPSAVPSPELRPSQNLPDLMRFEHADQGDRMWEISEEDKHGLRTPLCRTPTSELLHLAATHLPPPPVPQPLLSIFPNNVPLTSIFRPPSTAESHVPQMVSDSKWSSQSDTPQTIGPAAPNTTSAPPQTGAEQIPVGGKWWHTHPDQPVEASGVKEPCTSNTIQVTTSVLGDPAAGIIVQGEATMNSDSAAIEDAADMNVSPHLAEQLESTQHPSTLTGESQSPGKDILKPDLSGDIAHHTEKSSRNLSDSDVSGVDAKPDRSRKGLEQAFEDSVLVSSEQSAKQERIDVRVIEVEADNSSTENGHESRYAEVGIKLPTMAAGDACVSQTVDSEEATQHVTVTAVGDVSCAATKLDDAGKCNNSKDFQQVRKGSDVNVSDIDSRFLNTLSPDDSFTLGQPLDSSSTRSEDISDSVSPHVSPKKTTPRRSRLAAKFLNPF